MHKLQLNATELVEPDVDIVAMVKRGANRIPFRLTKKDGADMIDLSKIGATLFSKTATVTEPTVVGVIFAKGADVDGITETLKEAGLDLSEGFEKAESDKATTLTKADTEVDPEHLLVVKLDDDVAVTITGPEEVIKRVSGYDWESTSFSEVLTKGTFAPSLCMAQDMLNTTFWNIMEKADDREELSTLVKTAVGEFSDYVDTLVAAVPDSIFKADEALMKGKDKKMKGKDKGLADDMDEDAKEKDKATKEDIADAPTHGSKTTDTTVPKDGEADSDIEGSPAAGNETPKNPPTKSKGPGGETSNDIEGDPAADDAKTSQPTQKGDEEDPVMAMLKSMQASMDQGLKAVREHVDQSVSTVKEEVSGLTKKVAKTEAALEGTVVGDAEGDQTGQLTKSASTPSAPPLLDTAFMKLEDEPKAA